MRSKYNMVRLRGMALRIMDERRKKSIHYLKFIAMMQIKTRLSEQQIISRVSGMTSYG